MANGASDEGGGVVDPHRDKYLLRVSVGPSYDETQHQLVDVNGSTPLRVENEKMTAWVRVRIQDYHGLPQSAPPSNPYFNHPLHKSDRYSIGYTFVPKEDIAGQDLVMGFDFDHPVRDRLPPGFRTAMRIVTSFLDPGIYSDAYSDEPYLYGPALSSFFTLRIGEKQTEEQVAKLENPFMAGDEAMVIEEGADGSGAEIRQSLKMPSNNQKRRKVYLKKDKLDKFTFEAGRMYQADFFNPYLDFSNFALKLPGFSVSIAKYIDEKTHALRYVLRNKGSGELYLVVVLKLLFGKQLEQALAEDDGKKQEATSEPAVNGDATAGAEQPIERDPYPETNRSQPASVVEEKPVPKLESSAPSHPGSIPQPGPEAEEEEPAETSYEYLSKNVRSAFAALGFGSSGSSPPSSDSERSSLVASDAPTLNERVDDMSDKDVEKYLQARHSNI